MPMVISLVKRHVAVKHNRTGASCRKNGRPFVRIVSREEASEIREKEASIGMM